MRKIGLITLTLLLAALPGWAVRYGVKKQIYTGASMAYPTYLIYSSVSDRMYSGNAGPNNFLAMDCAGDSSLGPVAGALSPYPPAYDSVNNRFYYKGGNETFYAVDCAANTVDTSLGGWQGGTWTDYNPNNNKIYVNDDWNGRTHVYSAADYSFNGELTNYNGFVHYYLPTNSVYVPNANPLATKDSLGVFSGATNALTAEIYIPGLVSAFNEKMASNPAINRLYLALPNTDQVAIINTSSNTLVTTLNVADNPNNFALCPINDRMFVACNGNSQYSLKFINAGETLDSVQVGDSVSTVVYNPADSLIYIGCWQSGYVKLVDPRLATPMVVDSVPTFYGSNIMDMSVDQGGDIYCALYNSDNIYVIGQIPLRIWQSNIANGFWFDYMAWLYSDDGGNTWGNSLTIYPNNSGDSTIIIQAGHTIQQTLGGPAVTVDQLIVDGVLEQLDNSLTISDGPGDDLVVNGIFLRSNGLLTIDPSATLVFAPWSQYIHQIDGDTIPIATWDSLSTLNLNAVISTMPAGMDQAFGNVTWDGTQQAGDMILPGGPGFSAWNIFIYTTGPNSVFLTSAAKPELTINNLSISNGTAILGGGGPRKLHVKGNLEIYDPAWLYLTDTLNRSIDTLFLYGDYLHLVSGIGGGGPDSTAIVFCGTDTQSYMSNSEVLTGYIDYLVRPGSILDIPAGNSLGSGSLGNFTLMPGATLVIRDDAGIWASGGGGAVQVAGSRNFSKQANYCFYDGPGGYVYCGDGLPDTVNMLTINNTVGSGWYQEYYSLTVMDTFALLEGFIDANYDITLNGPVVQGTGYINGSTSVTMRIGGGGPDCVLPVAAGATLRGLVLDRPGRTLTLTGNLTIFDSLSLINGTLQTGSYGLMFEPNANITRNAGSELLGLFPPSFAGGANLTYGGGNITAGLELPSSPYTIQKFRLQNPADTVIVNQDTLGINDTLFLPGAIRFTGSFFQKNGVFDTMGVAGELIFTDTCTASITELNYTLFLPGISGGSLVLNDTAGSVMRRNITCTGPLNLVQGNLTVGANALELGDSLTGTGLLVTDSTSTLVFQGNAVNQILSSSVNHLGYLACNRPATLFVTNPLVLHDSLKLGQGSIDNSVNLSLRSGATIFRNSGILAMPAILEGPVDVIYGSHGGGPMTAGNELPYNATDLNDLTLSIGLLSNDTIALAGSAQINGRLSLQQGVLSVGANTLTLRDTIDVLMGQLAADSTSTISVINNPYLFRLPPNIKDLDSLLLSSFPGLEMADTVRIRSGYRQSAGRIGSGQLVFGTAATLIYGSPGADTTSNIEFPATGGPKNLTVATGGELALHNNRTIKGSLNLNGVLNTGANTITMDTLGTVVQVSGFVDGNLAKLIPLSAGTTVYYEMGTSPGGQSPANIQVFNNTVPAFVTAGIKGAGHHLVNDSSACLRKTWSFSGAGLAADASLITLNYLPADFNTGISEASDESTMVAGRYDNGATPGWQFPVIVTRNILGTSDGGSIVLSHPGNFADNPEFTLARDSMSIFNPASDTTLPYIASNLPADGATGVGLTDSVRITFSEPVRKSLISYTFLPNPGLVDTVWSADSTSIVFNHSAFAGLTFYTVRVTGVQDTMGNGLTGRDSLSFITTIAADTTLPFIASNVPLDGASTVGLTDSVRVTFSEPVRKSLVSYTFVPNPGLVDTSWSADSTSIVFNHSAFAGLTSYTVRVVGVQDTAGNALTGRDSIGFATMAAPDTIGPHISFVQPFAGQTGVMLSQPILIGFSEMVDSLSLRFTCSPNPGGWIQTWDTLGNNVFLQHSGFIPGTIYSFRLDSIRDISGNQLRTDTTTVPNPWSFTVQPNETLSTAWAGGAYKLFSVPLKPGNNSALANLGDDLGAYSDSTWLMFGYDAAGNSFPARPDIYNGYGYWLASAGNATIDIPGLQQDNYSTVGLQVGWNLIGCPFENPVLVPAIEVIDTLQQIRTYNDTTNNMFLNDSLVRQRMWNYSDHSYDFVNNGAWDSLSAFDSASHLQPWQGYAVYALQPCSLFMMPAFKSSAKGVRLVASPKVEVSWQAEFSASSGQAADRGIRIGVSPQAKPGYDRLDAEKPPLVSSQVTAYIPHQDWDQGPCRAYQYDFRPGSDHIEWPLTVKTASDDRPAELAYSLSQTMPEGYQLYLVDRRTGKATVMSNSGRLGFTGSHEFAVIYTNRGLGGLALKPLSFDLNQTYPNPFAQSITVNYQLAAAGQVSLKVYNVTGQLVRTLTEGAALPGYYSQTWNGRDNGGRKIASGIYIMRLVSGGQERTRKLVKIK